MVAAIVVAVVVAAFFALRADDSSADPVDTSPVDEPDVTIPDGPDLTVPDLTFPDLTFPDLTVPIPPELSLPDVTFPDGPPSTRAPVGSIPVSSEPPAGLGDDASLNALAEDCFDGSMGACDDLYDESDVDTDYRRYGDTCAGRQPEGTQVYCDTAFPS